MYSIEELQADVEELRALCEQTQRVNVKNILSMEIRRLETEIKERLQEEINQVKPHDSSSPSNTQQTIPMKKIVTYGWDQSEKFAKVYVTAKGVQNLGKDQVTCEFGERSFKLVINNLDGKNHLLQITNLHDVILPADSHHKVKTDSVLVMMRKQAPGKTWAAIVRKKEEKKDDLPPSAANPDDPSASLMQMMKKMYDDGDDEMKRNINKAWSESQEKRASGADGMPGLGF